MCSAMPPPSKYGEIYFINEEPLCSVFSDRAAFKKVLASLYQKKKNVASLILKQTNEGL